MGEFTSDIKPLLDLGIEVGLKYNPCHVKWLLGSCSELHVQLGGVKIQFLGIIVMIKVTFT